MKKLILSMIMISLLVALTGCNKDSDKNGDGDLSPTTPPIVTLPPEVSPGEEGIEASVGEEEVLTLEDYFPLEGDTEYVYEGTGNEYASYRRYIDYIDLENKKLQTRTNNGGTETVRVIQIKDGVLSVNHLEHESYIRVSYMDKESGTEAEILLMEPLTIGTKWQLSDGRWRSITAEKVPVTTPYGSFDALEVTTEGEDNTTKDYYAAGIGLVQSVFRSEGMEVTSTLKEVNKSTALTQPFTVFYPDADEKIYTTQSELTLSTGTEVQTAVEKAMKAELPKDSYLPLISANTKINSLELLEDGIVHVDFSREFVTDMNAGAGYELLILQSVTNTIGNYFGVSKVLITLEGTPYESGHVLMNEGETLDVRMDNVVS